MVNLKCVFHNVHHENKKFKDVPGISKKNQESINTFFGTKFKVGDRICFDIYTKWKNRGRAVSSHEDISPTSSTSKEVISTVSIFPS